MFSSTPLFACSDSQGLPLAAALSQESHARSCRGVRFGDPVKGFGPVSTFLSAVQHLEVRVDIAGAVRISKALRWGQALEDEASRVAILGGEL